MEEDNNRIEVNLDEDHNDELKKFTGNIIIINKLLAIYYITLVKSKRKEYLICFKSILFIKVLEKYSFNLIVLIEFRQILLFKQILQQI